MENKKKEFEKIQILSPMSYFTSSPSPLSPSPKSFKVRSPKSFIKKIKSSGSLNSIPLVHSSSNLSQKSNRSNHPNETTEDNLCIGLNIDTEEEDADDFFKTISSTQVNMSQKIKKMKVKKKKEDDGSMDGDKKNQLFSIEPPYDFVKKIMDLFLGKNVNNPYYQFSRKMLEDRKIVEEMIQLIPQLKEYYLKCKHAKYLDKIDSKKCITIFRQLLRVHGYKVNSTEKYQNGSKFLLYQVEKQKEKMSPKKINFTIDFD
jgi:hypothetical protein